MANSKKSNRAAHGVVTPPKDEQLKAKIDLIALLTYDARGRRRHYLVYVFILDWYYEKYGHLRLRARLLSSLKCVCVRFQTARHSAVHRCTPHLRTS
jgi:hypothetical protein